MSEWRRLAFFGLGFTIGYTVTAITLEVLLAIGCL